MTRRAWVVWPLLVGAAAFAVHLGALGNGFALDDVPLVQNNPAIASLTRLPRLFLEPYWKVTGEDAGLYRPVTIASFALNRSLTGASPLGFHLVNLLLHAAAAGLVWGALRRVGTHYGTALAGAGLFAVLPVHVEAVANVAGRAELLAAVFVLAAWIAHARAVDDWRPRVRWLAAGLYLLAVLSKESAIGAPVLFALGDAMRHRGSPPPSGRRRTLYAPYAGAAAAALALRVVALGAHQTAESAIALDNPVAAAPAAIRVLTALFVQAKLLALCAWPRVLVSDYSFDAIPLVRSAGDPRALAGLGAAAALAGAVVWGWRRSRPVALAACVWVVFALPSSNLLFPSGTLMAERLAYLPSLGACLLAGHLAASWVARASDRRGRRARGTAVGALAGIVVALLAARTWARVPAWKDNLTLATVDVLLQPRSAKLQAGAGIFLAGAGRAAEAEEHFRRAIEIYPEYAQIHYDLGILLARRGDDSGAERELRRAMDIAPGNPQPYGALAAVLDRLGRSDDAARVRAAAPR